LDSAPLRRKERQTMTIRFKLLAILCLFAGLLPAAFPQDGVQTTPPTFPEPAPKQTPDAQAPATSDPATPDGVRMFTGSVEHQKSGFVLQAGNTAYKLDDQSLAKQYKGKNVKVTGSLDKSTNTIHVDKIEASSSM
jgi:hypothetical protein